MLLITPLCDPGWHQQESWGNAPGHPLLGGDGAPCPCAVVRAPPHCSHGDLEVPLDLLPQEMLMSCCGVRNPGGCMCGASLSESPQQDSGTRGHLTPPTAMSHWSAGLWHRPRHRAKLSPWTRRSLQTRDVWSSPNMTGTLRRAQTSKWYSTRSIIMID